MHTVATWLDLAAHARSVADRVGDPTERAEMLDIARNYEQRAHEVASHVESARNFGAFFCAVPALRCSV
jgi:hypothetical protein